MSDFEVEISSADGSYRLAARSAAGETSPIAVTFPFEDLELGRRLQAVELALVKSSATVRRLTPVEERPVQEFGRQLFEFAFPPELRAHLAADRQQAAGQGMPLRVRLRVAPAELAALPWEFLYDPGRDEYLCLSTPLVRYLDVLEPRRPLAVVPPLRILTMIARPDELDPLDVEHERRRLTDALGPLQSEGRVQLGWVGGQTSWDLQDALDSGVWHGFHFIGHGGFDPHSGEGVLALAADDGGVDRVGAGDLALLLAEHRSMRLVVLNSCDTARASAGDRFSSTASVLIRRGIPAVVAMQYEISDPAAIVFARGFYTALARQHPVDQAVTRARRAIKLARRNTLEWATPVLYLRSATGALFDLTDIPTTPTSPPADTTTPQLPSDTAPPKAAAERRVPGPPRRDEPPARTSADRPPPLAAMKARLHPKRRARRPAQLARMTHDDLVWDVAFSPDGTRMATASRDGTARVWDPATGQELIRITHDLGVTGPFTGGVHGVAFSPDGTRLATAGGRTARVWNHATGQELIHMTHDGAMVNGVAFSPDGTRLATNSEDSTARVWDSATGRELTRMTHDRFGVYGVAFSPDSTRLATAGDDSTARVWDPATGRELIRMTYDARTVNAMVLGSVRCVRPCDR